jgi:signal transduction histidine kinase
MASAVTHGSSDVHERLPGKWLIRVRAVWMVLIVFLFVTFLVSIPAAYTMLTTVCDTAGSAPCTNWAQQSTVEILARNNLTIPGVALFNLVVFVAFSAFCWFAGLLVLRYRSRDWHGLLVSYLLITLAAGGPSFVFMSAWDFTDLPAWLAMVPGLTIFPMYLALSLFFQTFPDGKLYPRWARLGILLILANYAVWILPPPVNLIAWPPAVALLWLLFVYGFHIVIQAYRYRYYYTQTQRQQTKWLLYGAAVALVSVITFSLVVDNAYAAILEGVLTTVGFYLPIAAGVTIAILRHRLWDIDILINRTLVFSTLTAVLTAVYALIVTGLGQIVRAEGNFVVSLLGAGVIAVLFQPLRHWLQTAINRLMFGRRDEPLAVITELGASLEKLLSADAALLHLVDTTALALRLPYVAVERIDSSERIAVGSLPTTPVSFPLVYQAQVIGSLLAAARSPGEPLNAADRLVLEGVARQASAVVHAARLTHDLQASRQEILTTREEERRRLRRDLHDGLGPALATLTLQAEAAREWLTTNPDKSSALLDDIIAGSQSTLAEIRRIVYALRPPALDELGLLSAIHEQARKLTNSDLTIVVDTPESLPALPAAVEVATYRIIQEALTNVTRHARAHHCRISLSINGHMGITIEDDGVGIAAAHRAGVGLKSIFERVDELGGSCQIESQPGMGTRIMVLLPGH